MEKYFMALQTLVKSGRNTHTKCDRNENTPKIV